MLASYLFHITFNESASLQLQLREHIVTAILAGKLPLESPLPSTRRLAKALGISRNTVILAYEQLMDDGYLISKQRAGFYVNPSILEQPLQNIDSHSASNTANKPNWKQHLRFQPSQKRLNKLSNWRAFPYPFIYGQLDPELFPSHHWRECCKSSLAKAHIHEWQNDYYDEDDPLLIEQIQTRLLPKRGIQAHADEILITIGAQHALYMLLHLLLDESTTFGVEQPGYPDLIRMAERTRTHIQALQIDSQGLEVSEQLDSCQLVFTTPSHQFPTTVTMPIERRQQLLAKAAQEDFLIIEDDYECEITFSEYPTAALKSLDQDNRVIYMGSLSKTLSPGLRLGYIVADRELIQELREFRRMMIRHPPANNQHVVGLFLSRGYYDSQLMNLIKIYQERWQTLGEALQTHLPNSSEPSTFGGSAYWVKADKHLDTTLLKQSALEQGVIIESGDIYYAQAEPPKHYFRLGFSSIPTQRIEPGIKRLASIIDQLNT